MHTSGLSCYNGYLGNVLRNPDETKQTPVRKTEDKCLWEERKKLLLTNVTQSCVGCSAVGRYHASTCCFHRGTEKAEGWCCLHVIKRRLRAVGWLTDCKHDSVCYLTGSPSSFMWTVGNVEERSDSWGLLQWGLWKWKQFLGPMLLKWSKTVLLLTVRFFLAKVME